MKKKFFPFILALFVFAVALVAQMTIDGVESNAQKISSDKEKHALFENIYKKLKLTTTDNAVFELSKIQEKPVLLNFWASWCVPCMKEFKSLKELQKKFENKILIIGINNDEGDQLKEIKKVQNKMGITFPIYPDSNSEITTEFMINSIPATILFHKGKVIYFTNEEMDFMSEDFIELVEEALSE